MADPYLTLQDLKARGWTLGMVRALLGAQDHERATNKLGHQLAKPIKLYLETRVLQIETSRAFVEAKARASAHQALMFKALQTRQTWAAQGLARYEALTLPAVRVCSVQVENTGLQQELWQIHLQEFYVWQQQYQHLILGLSQAKRRDAERSLLQRYQAAVCQAYGWPEQSTTP